MHQLTVSTITVALFLTPGLAIAQSASAPPPPPDSTDASAAVSIGTPTEAVPPPPPSTPTTEIVAQPPAVAMPPTYGAYSPVYPTQMYGAMLRPVLYTGGPIPPGTHVERRAYTGLAIGGGVMFAVTYLSTALAGVLVSAVANTGLLFIPVLGPTIWVAEQPGAPAGSVAFFVIDSILQAGGIAMFVGGVLMRRPWLVPDRAHATNHRDRRIAWTLTPGPSTAPLGLGAALIW